MIVCSCSKAASSGLTDSDSAV